MLGWLAGIMIRRGVRRVNAGDIGLMLNGYSKNAVSVFPGDHSWGGEHRGKQQIVHQETYEDTQKVVEFDRYLETREPVTA